MKTRILTLLFCVCTCTLFAQFEQASFSVNGFTLPYRIMFPTNYDETKRYPLLVFLHGAGERGNDNEAQLVHGKDFLAVNAQGDYPAIVIAPQCPADNYWANLKIHNIAGKRDFSFGFSDMATQPMETLMLLINDWLSSGKVDTRKVYVGGLSMGGMGTFELLWRMPQVFAAAFPICGGGDTRKITAYAQNTAVWIFHGEDDSVVPVKCSSSMYDVLKNEGADVKYTVYKGVNHNSWDNVFQEKELFSWLFSHSR